MNSELPSAAKCYGVYDEDNIVAFMGVMHRPHPINKRLKGVTRLVVLPDYQGIGIGFKFLNLIANYYIHLHYDFIIRTSAKNLIVKLANCENWKMYDCSVSKRPKTGKIERYRTSLRTKCKAASFKYINNG